MRLQLIAVAAMLGGAGGAARGQDVDDRRVSGSLGVYADTDHMTVVSPRVNAREAVTESMSIDVDVTADVITGASVDVVSEASPVAIRELRIEGSLAASYRVTSAVTTRVRVRASSEDDYRALGAGVGARVELRGRTTVLDLALWGGRDRVEAVTRPDFSEQRTDVRALATWTQIVDRRTVVDAVGELQRRGGYLASPYRTVPIIDPASPVVMRLHEVVPGERLAAAGALLVRRAVTPRTFARLSYRYHRDDWQVSSHTARVACHRDEGRWRLGLELRAYVQSAAAFYRAHYELEDGLAPIYRTRERRLGGMASGTAGVTAEAPLREGLVATGAVSFTRFYWFDFAAQARRDGLLLTLGLRQAW